MTLKQLEKEVMLAGEEGIRAYWTHPFKYEEGKLKLELYRGARGDLLWFPEWECICFCEDRFGDRQQLVRVHRPGSVHAPSIRHYSWQ